MEASPILDELLTRAQAGEMAAFAALIRHRQRSVYSLALRMMSRTAEAEDVAQEAFIRLHRNLHSIASAAHLALWLRRVVINLAIDQLRRERNLVTAPLNAEAHSVATAGDGDLLLRRRLWQLIAKLPADPRAVMLLRYQEDLDPTEIAQTLRMPVNTVKSHLKRSLAIVRADVLKIAPVDCEGTNHD